ncbi:MAG TPA: DMT family transporter [Sphingomicrobium sp.]|nr:DMT family transporter [Sphingomicrobium sp.]
MTAPRQHPILAFAVALAAVAVLSVMDAVMKALVLAIGLYATSIWRALVGVLLSSLAYLPTRKSWPSRRVARLHLMRGAVVTVMGLLFFFGLGRIPMAQAIALTFIAPLVALFLAALTLGEQVGRRTVAASLVAFAGVLVIVAGQARSEMGEGVLVGTIAILGSALCYAVNIVMMRRQSLAAGPLEIGFFQNVTVAALLVASLPFLGGVAWPADHWVGIIAAALMSFAGVLLFAFAYARGEASYLAVTEYSGFLWAAALGWLIFAEPVSNYTLAGAVLIVGGCVFAAREKPRPEPEIEALAG